MSLVTNVELASLGDADLVIFTESLLNLDWFLRLLQQLQVVLSRNLAIGFGSYFGSLLPLIFRCLLAARAHSPVIGTHTGTPASKDSAYFSD